ncbi:MAG: response regulator [Magnetococcales bacterium]|nr:response regulator [Magnetococcales bacterium]
MSHEIRTPLNAVIGLTDLMLQESMPPRNRDYLRKISNSSRSLLRIINDILDFSKIEAGKLDLEQSDFRLRDVVDRLADIFSLPSTKKNIEFIFCISDGCRYALKGDALRLGQVLMNLISNSLKFTNEGEVEVQVLTVEESANQVELQFSVRDTGIGISEEQAEKLFQAFSQGDSSTTRKFGGTGLGLAISRKLVEMMGGRIWLTSELHQGTCLYFTATFKRRLEDEEQDMIPPEEMARLRTLVVTDNQALSNALFKMLNLFGFDTVVVGSSLEAIAKVKHGFDQQQHFQLVLVNWIMPDLDGVATAGQIKAMVDQEYQPKILLMIPYGYERGNGSQGSGIDGYLTKPINCSILFDMIMDIFGKDVAKSMRHSDERIDLADVSQKIGGARVLLVEDNQINQQVAEEILKGAALNVEKAENGVEAVTKVMESEYDLVLMDIQMPEMDGYEATRRIRNNAQFEDLPILAMTAHAMSVDRAKCLDSGMNDHLTKPIDRDKLYAALIQWIRPREGIGGLFPLSRVDETKGEADRSKLPETLPGIDMDAALKRVNSNRKLLRTLLSDFSSTYGNSVATLRVYLSQQRQEDIKAASGLVHTIKGVAANLSAVALYDAALALEKGIKENQQSNWPGLLDDFEKCMIQMLNSISTFESNAGETHPEKDTIGNPVVVHQDDIRPLLNRLASLLKKKDFKAVDCFEQLRPILAGSEFIEDMEQLAACMKRFDFNRGQIFLAAIARTLNLLLDE